MAWVERRQQGWVVRWRTENGEKPVAGPYGSRAEARKEAEAFEAKTPPKRRRQRATGPRPLDPLSIAQVAAKWRLDRMDNEERMERPGAQTYLDDTLRRVVAVAESWKRPDRAARPGDVTVQMAATLRKKAKRTAAGLRAILRWSRGHLGTPFDPMVDEALKPPPSKSEITGRLTDREARAVLARARRHGQLPLIACLMVYGWRPITACRLNVGNVDLKGARINLSIKHDAKPWVHPLFPFHVEMLRPLVEGRPADEPLFVPPRPPKTKKGLPHQRQCERWTISNGGSAGMLAVWFRRNMLRDVGTKQIRKLAISRMRSGEWPWKAPMDPVDVRRFTGQKTDAIVQRYEQTNMERARAFMADSSGGN